MSDCKSIIPREEIRLGCFETGRSIENAILSKNPPATLQDDEMNALIEPFINKVEKEAEQAVRFEIEEYIQNKEEENAEKTHQYEIEKAFAELEDRVDININGKRLRNEKDMANSLKKAHKNGWKRIKKCKLKPAELEDPDEDYLLDDGATDPEFDDYVDCYKFKIEPPFNQIIENHYNITKILTEHAKTRQEVVEILAEVSKNHVLYPEWLYKFPLSQLLYLAILMKNLDE